MARELKTRLRLKRKPSLPDHSQGRKKVLVRTPSAVSEAVFAEPALRGIRESFPDAALWLAGPAWTPEIYGGRGLFERTVALPPEENLKDMRGLLLSLRAERFSIGITLDDSIAASLLLVTARIPERWGYAREGPHLLLTKSVKQAAPAAPMHRVEHYRRLVRELGLKSPEDMPSVAPSADDLAAAGAELLSRGWDGSVPVVALAPGGGQGPAGRWSVERFVEAAALIRKERRAFTLLLVEGHDIDAGLAAGLPQPAGTVGPGLGPRQLTAFLGHVSLLIANDSQCLHLADALGKPLVALFGPTDQRITGPVKGPSVVLAKDSPCRPCSYAECPYDHRCLGGITVEEVTAAALSLPWAADRK